MARQILLFVVIFGAMSNGTRLFAQDRFWSPYLEMEGRAGSAREIGQGNLFLPLWQDNESLLFADLRGQWTDVQSAEGNWGLGYRKILANQWILGAYGFFDLSHSQLNNNFMQGTVGAELLNVNWGFRANVYVPDRQVKLAPGLNSAFLQGGTIVVNRGEERAYYGVDLEMERLLWHQRGNAVSNQLGDILANLDAELWATAGIFHFDNDTIGFESITGPRVRAELRLYDLPSLGNDSRLVVRGQYDYDNVRGSVGTGMVSVRIPIGPGGAARLDPLDRRMVTPIVRDIDIVSNAAAVTEPAKVAHTNAPINSAIVIDANSDLDNGVATAGANSVVIADGAAGTFSPTNTVTLQTGQVLMGGGSQLSVVGRNTGTLVQFTAPGSRPTITRTANSPAIALAGNTVVTGLTLNGGGAGGGNIGVFGSGNLGSAAVQNNIIEDFGGTGISLSNLTGNGSWLIENNTVRRVGADGIFFGAEGNSIISASIRSNLVEDTALDGLQLAAFTDSRLNLNITDNVVRRAGADTVRFDLQNNSVTTLRFHGNTLEEPASDGMEFDLENNAKLVATISNNSISNTTFGEGIEIDQDQSSQAWVSIIDNTISNTFADPLDIDLDNNSSGVYQVANNFFSSSQPGSIIDIDSNDNASLDLQVFGNSTNVNLDFDEDSASIFRMEDTIITNSFFGGSSSVIDPFIEIVPPGIFFPLPQ